MEKISLAKLSDKISKLEQKIIKLEDKYEKAKQDAELYRLRYNQLKKNYDKKLEAKIKTEVNNAINETTKKYQKIILEKDKRIFELEKRLNITSDNSNLPSSQNPLWKKNTKVFDQRSATTSTNKKSVGGQKKHKKNILEPLSEKEVTNIIEHSPKECKKCHCEELEEVSYEYHDVTDFEIVPKNTRHIFKICKCPKCGLTFKEEVPQNLWAVNQYGESVKTLGLVLNVFGDVSLNRIRNIITGLTEEKISPSEGYLAKLSKIASQNLKDFLFDIKEKIVKAKVIQHDDGVIKIGKTEENILEELSKKLKLEKDEITNEDIEKNISELKKLYQGVLRVYTADNYVLYKAHINKNGDSFKDDDILTRVSEDSIVVHDHMCFNYNDIFSFKNAECNIHAIRKGRSIKENTNHEWPDEISNLLEDYNKKKKAIINENKDKTISELHFSNEQLNNLSKDYDKIVEKGLIESEKFKWKSFYSDEINLLNFFKNYKTEILMWATNYEVPFTNNLCEGLIRLVKSKMKISYQFKSETTANYYADIISYTETCYRNGIDRYYALKRLFSENPVSVSEIEKIQNEKNSI